MKERKGIALMQVMVMGIILFLVCAMLVKWSLQMTIIRSKVVKSINSFSELEKARAGMWGCLNDNGYPSGSCTPTTAQRQCVPTGVNADFSGTAPDCALSLSVTR